MNTTKDGDYQTFKGSDGAYVQLSQSDAPEDVFVPYLGGGSGGDFADISGTGTRQAGGRQWVTYETSEGKRFWITDLGEVRIAVLSRGSDADIETIARATEVGVVSSPRGLHEPQSPTAWASRSARVSV